MRRITVVVAALALVVSVVALRPPDRAHGYSFDWFGQPYLRDSYGNYAYRDLTFTWGTWVGGWSWFSNMSAYVNFASTAFHYDSWGSTFGAEDGYPLVSYGGGKYLDYYNTPYSQALTPSPQDAGGTAHVWTGHCHTTNCAGPSLFPTFGSFMAAYVPHYATTGNCEARGYPYQGVSYCY